MRAFIFPTFLFAAGVAAMVYSASDHDLIGVVFGYLVAVVSFHCIRETALLEAEAKKTLR
jgi:hypothetical protein